MNRPIPRHVFQPLQPSRNVLRSSDLPAPVTQNCFGRFRHSGIVVHGCTERNLECAYIAGIAHLGPTLARTSTGSIEPKFRARTTVTKQQNPTLDPAPSSRVLASKHARI